MKKASTTAKPARKPSQTLREHIEVADDAIRSLASDLWEKAGHPDGRDEEFWLTARQQLFDAVKPPKPRSKKS